MASAALAIGLREYHFEDSEFSFNVSGIASKAAADAAVGYAVELDTTADGTVKLATDGGAIFGRIEACEYRAQEGEVIATISKRFIGNLPLKTAETPTRGSQLVGAGSGTVKANVTAATYIPGADVPHKVLTYDGTAHTVTVSFGI